MYVATFPSENELKETEVKKLRPNFALFDPIKIREKRAKFLSEFLKFSL